MKTIEEIKTLQKALTDQAEATLAQARDLDKKELYADATYAFSQAEVLNSQAQILTWILRD